jgi:uncharacterized membrane protein YphA (DoxX/SURF4 family)
MEPGMSQNVSIIGGLLMLAAVGAGRFSFDGSCAVHDDQD